MASILMTYLLFLKDNWTVLLAQLGFIFYVLWRRYQFKRQQMTCKSMNINHMSARQECPRLQHGGPEHWRSRRHHYSELIYQHTDHNVCSETINRSSPENLPKPKVCLRRHFLEKSSLGIPAIVKKSYMKMQGDMKSKKIGDTKCQHELPTSVEKGETSQGTRRTIQENLKQKIDECTASISKNFRGHHHHHKSNQYTYQDINTNFAFATVSKVKMCMLRHILEKTIIGVPAIVKKSCQMRDKQRTKCNEDLRQYDLLLLAGDGNTCQGSRPWASSNQTQRLSALVPPPTNCHFFHMASGDFLNQDPQTLLSPPNTNRKALECSIPRYLKKPTTKKSFKKSIRPSKKDHDVLTTPLSKILYAPHSVQGLKVLFDS